MTDRNPKAHLGVGWAFPVKPVDGKLQYARYEEDVEQAIHHILLTSHGERVMLRSFGAGLREVVFEPNSPATRARIEHLVKKALLDWEPRINVERVQATASDDEPNLVLLCVDYVVRATNTFYNRVYPFYLLEGNT